MKYYLTIVALTLVGLYFHNSPKDGVANKYGTKFQRFGHSSDPLRDLPNGRLDWKRLYGDLPKTEGLLHETSEKKQTK